MITKKLYCGLAIFVVLVLAVCWSLPIEKIDYKITVDDRLIVPAFKGRSNLYLIGHLPDMTRVSMRVNELDYSDCKEGTTCVYKLPVNYFSHEIDPTGLKILITFGSVILLLIIWLITI